jgi:hypothetical protein
MSVAFPSGYPIARPVQISDDLNTQIDVMDDNSTSLRQLGTVTYTTLQVQLRYLESSELSTLLSFINTNKGEEITWTIDSINYIGYIVGPFVRTMVGNRYNVTFTYRAKEVV